MEEELKLLLMETNIVENTTKEHQMAKELINGRMDLFTLVILSKGSSMDLENGKRKLMQSLQIPMKENTSMTKNQVRALMLGHLVISIMVISKTMNATVKGP